jgi:hypothetical protein
MGMQFRLFALVMVTACGRTALLHPADRPDAGHDTPLAQHDVPPADTRAALPRDLARAAGPEVPARDLPGDLEVPPDSPPARRDGALPGTGCNALKHLAEQGVLTKQRTKEVTFAPDRSWVVLRVRQDVPPEIGHPDQLLRVALPSGEVEMISSAGGNAEALGQRGGLLVLNNEDVAAYENGTLRTLASGACAHLATPDGSRLYVIRDCVASRGTLDVIDVASGTATTLATNVRGWTYGTPDFSISPDGRYFAFLVQGPDGGETSTLLNVADRGGKVYTLSSQRGATMPWFVSDELLLFSVSASGYPNPNGSLRAHVPGSGDTAYSLAPAGQAAGLHGYKVSADQQWLLGIDDVRGDAGWGVAGRLYAIRLDGTGENLLASTLVPHWLYQMGFDSFGWSGDGNWALYVADRGAVWASEPHGAATVRLSASGWYHAAPVGDQVAVVENTGDARSNQLRVLAVGPMRVVYSFGTDGSLAAPNFTPDARGLLFVSASSSGAQQLRYFSTSAPRSVVLGEWTETLLDTHPGYYLDDPLGSYPMDPTGCFTIVDTDLAPGPGTRLVLLPE